MNALLLIAGLGTRLAPYSAHLPKCLMPINGIPLLSYWLAKLDKQGFERLYLNVHYHAPMVDAFLAGVRTQTPIETLCEPQLLGTAGTLKALLNELHGDDLFFAHGDNYTSCDLEAFIVAHRQRPKLAEISLLSFQTDQPQQCGIIEKTADGLLSGFHEKVARPPGNEASAATYCLSAEALSRIAELCRQQPDISDFSNQVLPSFIGQALVHFCARTLVDIGTPQNLWSLQARQQREQPAARYIPDSLRALGKRPCDTPSQLLEQCQQWARALTASAD